MPVGGPEPKLPEAEFISLYETVGPRKIASLCGVTLRAVTARRWRIERRTGRPILPPNPDHACATRVRPKHAGRIEIDVPNGVVLIGSDIHIWPGEPSMMQRAFVQFCQEMKPAIVVLNGDVLDCASIKRHPPIGWERNPTVQEEIEAAQDWLDQLVRAIGKARKIWTLGNHDKRFETWVAQNAPEFRKVKGVHLQDHFPLWEPCWRVDVNGVVIKHRGKGGKHDAYNNALHSGTTVVTGHSHCPFVRGITDMHGTRYGVNCGMLADPDALCFLDYTEDSPYKDWRSAFAVLTFKDRRLMVPELVTQWDGASVEFRSEIIKV